MTAADPTARLTAGVTPCSIPECDTDGTGEPCDRHETEQAHAAGEHAFCGLECPVTLPSEQLRNAILYQAIPGSAGMLAELERRAAEQPPPPVLSDGERTFLTYALDAASDDMASRTNAPDDAEWATLASLRKLAGGEQA